MIRREDDGLWIDLRETISAHHEEVFGCLTTASGLSRWLPVAAEIDLRPGGTIVFGWDSKMDKRTTITILDFDPGGRIVWDWLVARDEVHAPIYWTVTPSVEDGAEVHFRQGPFDPAKTELLIAMAEEHGTWRWQLCNLRASLEMKYDMRKVRPL